MGVEAIRHHALFASMDWNAVKQQTITSSIPVSALVMTEEEENAIQPLSPSPELAPPFPFHFSSFT